MNGAPQNAREELVAELEELGYDTMPGVREDWADWRETFSDDQLRTVIRNINEAFEQKEALERAEAEAANLVDGDAPDFPDVSEMVEAMRGAVTAADAWLGANPDFNENATAEWAAWDQAFSALRQMVEQIDKASARAFGGSDA